MAKIETQSFPRPCNVMPAILKACRRRPRTYDYLESVTGSTHDVQHVATKRGR